MSTAAFSFTMRALLFGLPLLPVGLLAQVPQAFEFQGIARDAAGNPMPSQAVQLRLGILSGSPTGTLVYQETQSTVTSPLGLFGVQVGNGTPASGTFAGVPWGTASHFLNVELDPLGGSNYQLIGTTHLLSVPYALVAGSTPCYTVSMIGDTLHEGPDCYVIVPGLSAANGGCSDVDGDGYFSLAGCGTPVDCNDGNPAVHPGIVETCDGADNDCDGDEDEDFNVLTDPLNCGGCGIACDDGIACTIDACSGGTCTHNPQPGTCLIAGVCYTDGSLRPDFPCQVCSSSMNDTGWTNSPSGTSCPTGTCDGNGACTE